MLQLVKATLTVEMWINMRGFSDKEFIEFVERSYGIPQEAAKFFPGLKDIFKERFGKDRWQRATREQLQFQADVSVVPGSSRPRNLDTERNQWLTFLRIIGQFPQLALSRALLGETAKKFEFISERMLDELNALAKQMVDIQQKTAGREQGGGGDGAQGGGGLGDLLASVTGGRQQ